MRKLGRNDPCYCGSGKKYKKCCLPEDEAGNIVRLAPPEHPSTQDEEEMLDVMVESLTWASESQRQVTRAILGDMCNRGGKSWEYILNAIPWWYAYCQQTSPVIREKSIPVFAAALDYVTAVYKGRKEATQAELAERYGVSVSSVSRRCREIMDVIEYETWGGGSETALDGERVHPLAGVSPEKQEAEALLHEARKTPSEKKRLQLARKALKLYPDSPDAYNIIAEFTPDLEEARELYYQGMKAGEKELGDAFEVHKGFFWGLTETRPYMRSKQGYAETCELLGDLPEAVRHYEEMLELNPADNQGIRYMLLGSYCQMGEYEKAYELLERYPEDTAYGTYDRMLVEYGLHGITSNLRPLLREARKSNPYVTAYLTGKKGLPSSVPASYIVGDESEAVTYALERLYVWSLHLPLIHWLNSQK